MTEANITPKTIALSAIQSSARARYFSKLLAVARALPLLLAIVLHTPLAQAQPSTRQVTLPNQDYMESTEDLVVKVAGGQVAINRTWTFGRWYLNDRWSDLVLQPDPLGGVLAVSRTDRVYTRVSGTAPPTAAPTAASVWHCSAKSPTCAAAPGATPTPAAATSKPAPTRKAGKSSSPT